MAQSLENTPDAYPLVTYGSPAKTRDAFLDAYSGPAGYDRYKAGKLAGVASSFVDNLFSEPKFIDFIEKRLQASAMRRSSLQEDLLTHAQDIITSNAMDLFEKAPDGGLLLRDPEKLPLHVQNAVASIRIARVSEGGSMSPEFREIVDIKMHDKAKFINVIADYSGLRESIHNQVDTGAPKIVGLSLITAKTEEKDDGSGSISGEHREIQHDGDTEEESP